jgi:hypothetical protein
MINKIDFIMILALPLSLFAQDKLSYVNIQEIFHVMP